MTIKRQGARVAEPKVYQTEGLLPKSVNLAAALQEANRRYLLLERWGQLGRSDRLGQGGEVFREEYAKAPAELVQQCHSLADVPHPSTLDGVLRRAKRMFADGKNGALATLGRLGPRKNERQPKLPEDARDYVRWLWTGVLLPTKQAVLDAYNEDRPPLSEWPVVSYSTISRLINAIKAEPKE